MLFSILIVLSSCNKNEKKKISDDLLNCCYKKKSYWVYIDSVSNNTDSIYVVDYDHYFNEHYVTDHTSYDVEYFKFYTNSSSNTEAATYEIVTNSLVKIKSGTNHHTIVYHDYDNTNDGDSSQGYIFEHLDSVYIYDRYYYRVLKAEVLEDENENNNKSIYFTNSEYGILRHDIYSDSILLSQKVLMRKKIKR